MELKEVSVASPKLSEGATTKAAEKFDIQFSWWWFTVTYDAVFKPVWI